MTLQAATYHYLSCNGKLNNLVRPDCPALSEGTFEDKATAEAAALSSGWSKDGRSHLCPECTRRTAK